MIFSQSDIPAIVQAVFNTPIVTVDCQQAFGGRLFGRQAGDPKNGLFSDFTSLVVYEATFQLEDLASLPWEFLYRKETRDFLNLSRFTPIIRYLDVQRPYSPLPLDLPLRILVIISDPVDYPRLDLDRERSLIESSWAKHEGVQVEFMEQATILALQDRLSEQPYHVLHYMGHGGLDKWTGRGVLVMEDEGGQGSLVDGRTLGILLRDLPMMRLAFLNACETAKATKEKGVDPFAGVAAAMVLAGIPAVVAMQFPVSDKAAITFSQKFYPLLARGEPVDAAVAEGRRAIRLAANQTMEWGTPVLFLRAPQGIIFQVSEIQREKVPVPTVPEIPEIPEEEEQELEKQIADIYTRALSFFWLEEWEKAARNFQTIVKVRPNYEDAAEKLVEARRQAKLHALYAQALSAEEEENWSNALAALQELTADAAGFKDSAERLERIKVQNQLAELYDEALHLHQAQQWQAVVKVFKQIHIIEPNYPDPEGVLSSAQQEVDALKHQEDLNDLYSLAVRQMDAGHWQEAHELLVQVQEMEPGFQETERLLDRVEKEIDREKREHQRQEQIATSYEQALGLAQAQQWRQVLAKMDEIQSLDPEFSDPEGLAAVAREELTKEDEEARRQSELATMYAEAVRLLEAEQYQQVLEKWGEVQARDPRYPDRQNVQGNARKKLESLAKGAPPRRRLPSWATVSVGGAVIVIVIFGIIIGARILPLLFPIADDEGLQTATETPTEEPMETEAPPEVAGDLVGIILPTTTEPRWLQDEARFFDAFDELGVEAEILFSDGDVDKERANVEDLITKGVKVIIYTPHDGTAAAAAAEAARDAGVKVVSYDRLILDTEAVDYWVTFDNIAVGEAQGQYLVDKASGSGNPLYLYAGAAYDNNAFLFFEGAWNVLQPKIADGTFVIKNSSEAEALQDKAELTRDDMDDIIGQITTEWDFDTAKSLAEANLVATTAADKGDVFILAPNDYTARAIADEFAIDADVSSYVITGQDADIASVQYIIDGKQSMTVLKDARIMADDAINAAIVFLEGSTPLETQTYNNGVIDVPAKPSELISVDRDNVQEEIIDSGYWPAEEFTGLDG